MKEKGGQVNSTLIHYWENLYIIKMLAIMLLSMLNMHVGQDHFKVSCKFNIVNYYSKQLASKITTYHSTVYNKTKGGIVDASVTLALSQVLIQYDLSLSLCVAPMLPLTDYDLSFHMLYMMMLGICCIAFASGTLSRIRMLPSNIWLCKFHQCVY